MCEVVGVASPRSCILECIDLGLGWEGIKSVLCGINGNDIVLGFPGSLGRGGSHCEERKLQAEWKNAKVCEGGRLLAGHLVIQNSIGVKQ